MGGYNVTAHVSLVPAPKKKMKSFFWDKVCFVLEPVERLRWGEVGI
jgi:hypothetical protein